ncbi:hypothetical protein [Bradyrhizobium sp. Cp5.3]|uniref:hypothetical protein n=1 Tax=Bradyrhizobium sp. Cp5.3 TaxID=443598 RepID=UPI0012EB736A|nr:hypothetical protein [Bradyrhizobium sp. Cp5.3]
MNGIRFGDATRVAESIGERLSTLVLPVRDDAAGKLTMAIASHGGVLVREDVIPGGY